MKNAPHLQVIIYESIFGMSSLFKGLQWMASGISIYSSNSYEDGIDS